MKSRGMADFLRSLPSFFDMSAFFGKIRIFCKRNVKQSRCIYGKIEISIPAGFIRDDE